MSALPASSMPIPGIQVRHAVAMWRGRCSTSTSAMTAAIVELALRTPISRSDEEKERWPALGGIKTLQKFTSARASIHNHFNHDRHLNRRAIFKESRSAALAESRELPA
jgi:hypothetical protein